MADSRYTVDEGGAGLRLDRFLADASRLGSRGRATAALERGKVFVNGREATTADAARRLVRGDAIRVWMDRPGSAKARWRRVQVGPLDILYEDASILVVNKPPGILTVPLAGSDTASIPDLLGARGGSRGRARLLPVHRIDRDTSGLVVFAKTAAARDALREQFAARKPERVYLAVVHGCPQPEAGEWRDHLVWDPGGLVQWASGPGHHRAVEAISTYRVRERLGRAALVEVQLVTGKRNQIRVQAAERGHRLVGERKYGRASDLPSVPFGRQALHAASLSFRHPADGRVVRFQAPLPDDMAALIRRLRRS